jgi:hypothetical protein
MTNTVPQADQHLDESPTGAFILGSLTAETERDFKALATTIWRGITLLQDGYAFVRANAGVYIVASPEGSTYTIAFNPAQHVASCTCEACVRLGTCKHLVCLHLNQVEIDAENDQREEEQARQYSAPKTERTASYWDGWNAFLDEIEAKN